MKRCLTVSLFVLLILSGFVGRAIAVVDPYLRGQLPVGEAEYHKDDFFQKGTLGPDGVSLSAIVRYPAERFQLMPTISTGSMDRPQAGRLVSSRNAAN